MSRQNKQRNKAASTKQAQGKNEGKKNKDSGKYPHQQLFSLSKKNLV